MSPVLLVCATAVLLLAYLLRRMPQAWKADLPLPIVAAILITIGAIVVGAMSSQSSSPGRTASSFVIEKEPAPATGQALSPGEKAPQITAAGWVNGPPGSSSGIRVIDVWAPWCLVCHEIAPGMVRVHDEYAPRGVQFVSLTDMSKAAVDGFVGHFEIPWSSGFGVPKQTIDAFRALRAEVLEPERQVAPTLYVVDAEGIVLWSDDAGRYRHENVDRLLADLSAQLDKALDD